MAKLDADLNGARDGGDRAARWPSLSSAAGEPKRPAQPQLTQSKSVSETVNGSHLYTIKGYSLSKGMGPGKYISSDTFTVGGYQWAIYFYPDGKNPEDGALYVSVFIALASDGTDVRALFELTLLDQSGKEKHKVHSHFDRALESGPYTLKYKGSMWGYKRFFRRSALETSDYIKDDCLAMRCTVGVVRTRMEAPWQFSVPVPPSDMGQCLGKLLETGLGSDVVFKVGDESFRAHKLILAARSPVFRAQFFGLIGDPTSALTSTILVQHLLAAADRYGLDRLKLLCEEKLCREITPDTHQCALLKSICLKYAAVRPTWAVGAPPPLNTLNGDADGGFGYLEETCPSLLSDLWRRLRWSTTTPARCP
ncbi:unnamed protein product [Spirodela intermedia]|uniref:BTB/POZ and MATH domain-containing protein 3 n=1 Tax=Spirodela intermedia TaxID=51605 RepID=A0ABN7EC18_SPIIN|nr:unnamed protein product [Spirodela intermedia]